jgi:hypothetical protein
MRYTLPLVAQWICHCSETLNVTGKPKCTTAICMTNRAADTKALVPHSMPTCTALQLVTLLFCIMIKA